MDDRVRVAVLVVACLGLVVATAASCSTAARNAGRLAQSGSDDVLRGGIVLGNTADELAPSIGSSVRSHVSRLSDDEDVQDAAYGLAWDVMCDVVTGSLPDDLDRVTGYVLAAATSFALSFTDEGAQIMGAAIIDELDGQESEIRVACGDLQPG